MNMDKILDKAIEMDASDVHLIAGNKPMLRISREETQIKMKYLLIQENQILHMNIKEFV